MSYAEFRREYAAASLDRSDLKPDPIDQFHLWFADAVRAEVLEPTAMTLATCTAEGVPSARVVLLKDVDQRGLTFYTDYRSPKSRDLDDNPRAAVVFLWKEVERQVRVSGSIARVSREESARYFASRPLGSQVGAWASVQSARIPDREWLDARVRELAAQYGDTVPLPDHWGGWRLVPGEFEFWQGRPNRLHDRWRYLPSSDGWRVERLSP